jgi:hypothetical protein
MSMIQVLLAAALALGATAPSQDPSAQDQGVRPVPARLTYGPTQKCGASLTIRVRGVSLRNQLHACPAWAVLEPPHHQPTPKPGHNIMPGTMLPIVKITMQCSADWLFHLIPVGGVCTQQSSTNIGAVQSYVQHAVASDK